MAAFGALPTSSADTYADRTPLETNDAEVMLLPNGRRDAVQRLLEGGAHKAPETSHTNGQPVVAPRQLRCLKCLRAPAGRTDEAKPLYTAGSATRRPFLSLASPDTGADRIDERSFVYLRELGKGTFGSVYLVKHKQNGTAHAMKVMMKSKFWKHDKGHLRYALTERDVLSFVKHPYIVFLDFAFQTAKELALVMQYCPGGDLKQAITKSACGRLQEPIARHYAAEVLLAFEYLHERQIIHRDLKPDNVILDKDGHCLLTDFGLSKEHVRRNPGTSSFVGSVTYVAPEVVQRRGHNHTVDLWALGVLLFEMLTGRAPFYGSDREKMMKKIVSADLNFGPHPHVSLDAESAIRSLRRRDPSRRLGSKNTADVRHHVFFDSINFGALLKREVPVPDCAEPSVKPAEPSVEHAPIPNPFGEGWRARLRKACCRLQRTNSAEPPRIIGDWSYACL